MQTKIIKCPTCNTECEYSERNEFRPFCSSRCKNKDLLAWADENFKVPGAPASAEDILDEIKKDN